MNYFIIGASAAGMAAVRAIRENDEKGDIVILYLKEVEKF